MSLKNTIKNGIAKKKPENPTFTAPLKINNRLTVRKKTFLTVDVRSKNISYLITLEKYNALLTGNKIVG
jgi:hypothetical protein